MRFTEHELTTAVTGAAKTMVAAQDKAVRKGQVAIDDAWQAMPKMSRYHVLSSVGDQILTALVALPEVEVAAGERPTFTDVQIARALEETARDSGSGRVKRLVEATARAALLRAALASLPPRVDPDALIVPDHL